MLQRCSLLTALTLALAVAPLAAQRPGRVRAPATDTANEVRRPRPVPGVGEGVAPRAGPQLPGAARPGAPAAGAAPDSAHPGAARDSMRAPGQGGSARADTTAPAVVRPGGGAAAPPEDSTRLHLGLETLGPVFPTVFPAAPGHNALWLRPRVQDWTGAWAAAARKRVAARLPTLALRGGPLLADSAARAKAAPADDCCRNFLPPPPRRDTAREHNTLVPGAIADYADLGIKVKGRGELGTAWTRYYPCDPTTPILCNPSLFPQLKPDVQFGLQIGGTISDRVHVNVDFDQRREFDAANNLNVYYQGFEDEVLQRLEVGDVSIRLPQSRYLTQGIPAGNFGFKATGQLGPMDFQAVFAQQKGDVTRREFKLNGGAGQTAGLVQDASVVLDDGDYVKGQFFFIVHPDSLRGAPHVNVLQLQPADAPTDLRPAPGTLVLYRDERISPSSQQQIGQLGYFLADAVAPGSSVHHGGYFRRLQAGEDYIAHASGLWIVLRSPLRQDEALAVGYINQRGDTIGSINADAQRTGTPTLRLLRGPVSLHQPGQTTWPYELHNVYRVDASSGVDVSSVALQVSLGQLSGGKTFTQAGGKQITYLKLMGLDELPAADQLDAVQIYQPSPAGATASAKVGGTFVVFPTLNPFAAPPPVPSAGLSAAASAAALGPDANHDIYENPDPVVREAASRFRLNFTYRVKVEGMVSTLNLGALGIREGSEKIYVAGKELQSGKDYTIDYDIGTVTLLDPQSVYAGNPDADIRATWEQKAMFQLAPTSIFGLNTRYKLGSRGELNLIGLYQAEKSIMARPELGNEPSSIFLGGASGRLDLGGHALDRLLSWVPGMHASSTPSAMSISGEAAMSSPNPNRRGATYVDDFEAGDETPIALNRQSWRLGSRPDDPTGATGALPSVLDLSSAMRLTWQHDLLQNGQIVGGLTLSAIDKTFNTNRGAVSGGQDFGETALWLTMGGDSLPGHQLAARRWRSITTVLSTTGRDLSRSEFLELYVEPPQGDAANSALVIDMGKVGEDAFYFDSKGQTSGHYPDGKAWGLGVLDQEADLAKHEIWGTAADTAGLWNQECRAERGASYALGDVRANCTRGNGIIDTEDLNGDGVPSLTDGAYYRFVIKLGAASPYLVRDENGTGSRFRLYRIPLRGTGAIPVGGANLATWRFVQHLRMTIVDSVGASPRYMRIAHMRIIGSRWAKRDVSGLAQGLVGTTPLAGDTSAFQVGPASSLTDGEYASPPGIVDQLQDPTAQFNLGAAQVINEKSLRLSLDRLAPQTRAEVFYRYPQQPRNFLNYRQMRLFALARKGNWGGNGSERLLIKLGSDPRNYYLYQARLNPAQPGKAASGQWLPEIAVDFQEWFKLRAQAEQLLLTTPRGTDPLVLWSRDSSYAVVMEDRARAPNLAAVRELSFAVYNGGLGSQPAEVWIDDLRLSGALTDPGFAGNVTVDLRAGDFLQASASVASQASVFHQLNQDPTYQRTGDASLNGTAQLGLLTPPGWDLDAPLTFSWGKTALAPQFLSGTDVPADQLENLRAAGSNRLHVGFSLRRRTPAANPLLGLLVDGLNLRLGYTGNANGTATSLSESSGLDGAIAYDRRPSARELDVVPAFLEAAVKALFPSRLEKSELFRRLTTARLRWTPEAVSFSSAYYNQRADAWRYDQILKLPTDTLAPTTSARLGLDNDARISLHPFESLTAELALGSSRDLLPAARASDQLRVQQAIQAARGGIGGLDLGWEANRSVSTQLDWRPVLAAWLRPGLSFSGRFRANRNPSFLELVPLGADSLAADSTAFMQRQFQGDRQLTRSLRLDPTGMVGALFAKPSRLLGGVAKAVQPLDLTWTTALNSQFDRASLAPGAGYQLGLGALNGWRFMSGDTASVANTRSSVRGRTAVTLPFGTELAATYDGTRSRLLDLRGGERADESHTWPALQVTWSAIPLPKLVKTVITQAGLSGGYQHTRRTSQYGSLGLVGQSDSPGGVSGNLNGATSLIGSGAGEETAIPVQLTLGLLGSLSASYNGSISDGTSSDPTGDAQKNGSNHALTVSGFFKAPQSLRGKFPNPVQATFGLSQQGDRQCRVQPGLVDGGSVCTPFIDYTSRRVNLSLDTELSQLTVGFQMSYNARKSNIGTLNGSSQFQLGIFGQFNINAGQLPGVGR